MKRTQSADFPKDYTKSPHITLTGIEIVRH